MRYSTFVGLTCLGLLATIALAAANSPVGEEISGAIGVVVNKYYNQELTGKQGNKPASYTITVAVDGRWATMEFDTKSGEVFHVGQTVRVNYKHAWLTRRIHLTSVTPIR